jgi:PelA/Pel-15E family pectate lyase
MELARRSGLGLVLASLVLCPAAVRAGPASSAAEPPASGAARPRVLLVGDSTVTDAKGWGVGFRVHLPAGVECVNLALGGRSSKSFRAEGHWAEALERGGDYVLIQFGHNDMPGKGQERETDPATTYPQNLARYVDDARAAGLRPVLVTSLTRRRFGTDGRVHSDLGAYVEAMERVAREKDVPIVDLHRRSVAYLDAVGPEAARVFSPLKQDGTPDLTHLTPVGSLVFGQLVADELRALVPELFATAVPAGVDWRAALAQPAEWYGQEEARCIAGNVILWQRSNGGWPKNVDMARALSSEEARVVQAGHDLTDTTIDNGATYEEVRFLALVRSATGDLRDAAAALRGIDFLLAAQYPSGGWPQFFPLRQDYSRHITYNDGAMIGAMRLLRDAASGRGTFAFVDAGRRRAAAAAVTRGVRAILDTQVVVDGRRTVWCAQHDAATLEPRPARSFEPVSLSGEESVGVVELLMDVEREGAEIVEAVEGAIAWFRAARLPGLRLERVRVEGVPGGTDVVVRQDPAAPGLWARFYEIDTNRPIFAGRDGVVRYSLAEIEHERRVHYAWYGTWPRDLLDARYPAWKERVTGRVAAKPSTKR